MLKRPLWIRALALERTALLIACVVLPAGGFATTYARPEPDAWFSLWFQVEKSSLPERVEFRRYAFPEFGIDDTGFFSNPASTPLYLVTRPSTPPNWVRELPANVIPSEMAVSGAAFRMEDTLELSRVPFHGIRVSGFVSPPLRIQMQVMGEPPRTALREKVAYLGSQKIVVRGRYIREPVNRFQLDEPLPAPLRLAEVYRGDYVIVNDGPVPLYLGYIMAKPAGWATEVPFGYLATHKFVKGDAYSADWAIPSTDDGWVKTRPYEALFTEHRFTMYVPGFEFKQVYRDRRPADVKVPDAQPFEMTAFYGSRKVTIRGRVVYDLNPNYDPLASQRGPACMSCTGDMCDECAKHVRPRGTRKPPLHPATY